MATTHAVNSPHTHLVSLFVCRRGGQADFAQVSWCCVIFGQLGAEGLVGHLDLSLQIVQEVVHAVLGDWFSMPVIQILDIYADRKMKVWLR